MRDSMMKSTSTLLGLVLATLSQAQTDPLIKQDFKADTAGWTVLGQSAKVTLTHDAPAAAANGGALHFDYKVEKGEMDALLLPAEVGSLAKAQSFKFRAMADHDTSVAVMLQEKDGGRYVAMCRLTKGVYQQCELSTADFFLSQDVGDPKDPDGKLDLDQVNGIGIIDLHEIFVAAGNPELEKILGVDKGAHSLYLDQFSVESQPVPPTASVEKGVVTLDSFAHPQLAWFATAGLRLQSSQGDPLTGSGMKWTYKQEPNKMVAAAHPVNPGSLKGTQTLSFDLAAMRGGTMTVQIEATDGNKFSTSVDIPFGSKPKHIALNFSDFRSTDDSADPNGKLDLSKIKNLLLMDISGMMAQADPDHPDNTLWISHIVAK